MSTILLIILILLLIGALPTWPYSSGWGYYPSGGLGLIVPDHRHPGTHWTSGLVAGAFSIRLKGIASKKKIVIKRVDALKSLYTGDPAPRTAEKAERREEKNQAVPKTFSLRHS